MTDRDAAVLAALRAVPAGALPMHLAPGLGLGVKQVSTVLQRLRIAGEGLDQAAQAFERALVGVVARPLGQQRAQQAEQAFGPLRRAQLQRQSALEPRQHPQQPVGQILEVVQPLADIGIARLGEAEKPA